MGILCVDVGRGTRDILYYEKGKKIENCPSLVLPSWSSLVRGELEAALEAGQIPVFFGGNMGGFSLKKYHTSGRRIMATPQAASTFDDDPDQWEKLGVEIVEDLDSLKGNFRFIETRDIDHELLCKGFSELGVCLELEGVAVAVQDHGKAPPGVSDRKFRFQRYEEALHAGLRPADFAWPAEDLPPYLTRMKSTAERLKNQTNVLLMDSGMAALAGALEDPIVFRSELKIIVNVGNSHTLAAFLHGEKIMGLIEHHTGLLDGEKIGTLIENLATGEVNGERIFQEGGHGGICLDYPFPGMDALELVCVTGPNRDLLSSKQVYFTAPYGNMMLTGAYGLLRAHQRFFG
jgi:uncharacterized protein (DUF1786 family)